MHHLVKTEGRAEKNRGGGAASGVEPLHTASSACSSLIPRMRQRRAAAVLVGLIDRGWSGHPPAPTMRVEAGVQVEGCGWRPRGREPVAANRVEQAYVHNASPVSRESRLAVGSSPEGRILGHLARGRATISRTRLLGFASRKGARAVARGTEGPRPTPSAQPARAFARGPQARHFGGYLRQAWTFSQWPRNSGSRCDGNW